MILIFLNSIKLFSQDSTSKFSVGVNGLFAYGGMKISNTGFAGASFLGGINIGYFLQPFLRAQLEYDYFSTVEQVSTGVLNQAGNFYTGRTNLILRTTSNQNESSFTFGAGLAHTYYNIVNLNVTGYSLGISFKLGREFLLYKKSPFLDVNIELQREIIRKIYYNNPINEIEFECRIGRMNIGLLWFL
jgi:hypothetical protein